MNDYRLMPDAGLKEILDPRIEERVSKFICTLCARNSGSKRHELFCGKNAGSMSIRHNCAAREMTTSLRMYGATEIKKTDKVNENGKFADIRARTHDGREVHIDL